MRFTWHPATAGVLVGLGWYLSPIVPAAAEEPAPTIEAIVKAWKDRQEKVKNATFEFDATRTLHKGSTDHLIAMAGGKLGAAPNPPQDFLVKGKSRLAVDGAKLRYVIDLDQWDPETRALYVEHYEDAFNGEVFKFLRSPNSPSKPYPVAEIRKAKKSPSASQYTVLPVLAMVNGDPAGFVEDLGRYQVSPKLIPVTGRPCVELVQESRTKGKRYVVYLDSQRGFTLVRKMTMENEKPTWQLDVTSALDTTVGWVPKSWEYVVRSSDAKIVVDSGGRVVTSYTINPKVGAEEFDFKLPSGTAVRDLTSGKPMQSVIQANGDKGGEVPGSAHVSYDELKQLPNRRRGWVVTSMAAGGVLLVLGAAFMFTRRFQRVRQQRQHQVGQRLAEQVGPPS